MRRSIESEFHQIQELKMPHLEIGDREFSYRRYIVNMVPNSLPAKMNENVYKMKSDYISFM